MKKWVINYQRHKAKEEDCREQSVCDHAARMANEISIVDGVELRRIDTDIGKWKKGSTSHTRPVSRNNVELIA